MELPEGLEEQEEKARDPFDRKVAVTMAVIAALLALVAVGGHLATTEELLKQQKASDTWAFYQAKNIRRYESGIARDLLSNFPSEAARKKAEQYNADSERYEKDGEGLQETARDFEKESSLEGRRARRFHAGEVFLELAIVFSSLAILTKRGMFWQGGIGGAGVGVLIAATAFLLR